MALKPSTTCFIEASTSQRTETLQSWFTISGSTQIPSFSPMALTSSLAQTVSQANRTWCMPFSVLVYCLTFFCLCPPSGSGTRVRVTSLRARRGLGAGSRARCGLAGSVLARAGITCMRARCGVSNTGQYQLVSCHHYPATPTHIHWRSPSSAPQK